MFFEGLMFDNHTDLLDMDGVQSSQKTITPIKKSSTVSFNNDYSQEKELFQDGDMFG